MQRINAKQQTLGRWLTLSLLLTIATVVNAAIEPLPGSPPMTRYVPDLGLFPQNFAIVQAIDGRVFMTNSDAIALFDGTEWQSIALPDWSYARVLAIDTESDRLYVGGYDDFGYISPDGTGGWAYSSLTDLLDERVLEAGFADIWHLTVTPFGVFFGALKHQFLYDPNTHDIRVWEHDGRFGFGTMHGDQFVLQFRGEGLRSYDGDDFRPIVGSEHLTRLISHATLLADGRLLMASNLGWQVYDGRVIESLPAPPALDPMDATTLLLLDDGSVAIGTVSGEIIMFQPSTGQSRQFRVTTQHIGDLALSQDGGLLALVDTGFFYIGWPARWTLLADSGINSGIYDLVVWNDRLYANTSAGVFEQTLANRRQPFDLLPWPAFEAWQLLPLTEHQALLADSYALKLIDNGLSIPLSDETLYPRALVQSPSRPDRIYVGTEQGYAVLDQLSGTWQLTHRHDNVSGRVLTLAEAAPDTLLLGTEGDGAILIKLDPQTGEETARRALSLDDGIDYGEYPNALLFRLTDQTIGISTERGIYSWLDDRFSPLDLGDLLSVRGEGELVQVYDTGRGGRWAASFNHVYRQASDGSWQRESVEPLLDGAIDDVIRFGSSILVSSGSRILIFDESGFEARVPQPRIMLSKVVQAVGGEEQARPLSPTAVVELPYGSDSSIRFSWTSPMLVDIDAIRFQTRLAGAESRQSSWRRETSVEFAGLSPGDYDFQVIARDAYDREIGTQPYSFRVLPPWYQTNTALAIWVLLALLALALFTRLVALWHSRTLHRRALALEQEVAARTRELRTANRKLDAMAHVDGLTGIANRRRLEEMLQESWSAGCKSPSSLTLLLIDVDHFKQFNDKNGHLAGDLLLRRLGELLRAWVEPGQLAARYGGEEFMLVLPGVERTRGLELAEQLRRAIERAELGSTVSIGVACADTRHAFMTQTPQALVDAADNYMYKAKAAGRNRVMPQAA